jgi:hypothetical protein
MFIGHFAAGFAAKRAAPALSLGTLFAACQLADLVWPLLVLAGVERFSIVPGITAVTPLDFEFYPYSHSLLALAVWGALAALMHRAVRGRSSTVVLVTLAATVVSHWLLDAASHRPDMPVLPSGPFVGIELWASRPLTMAVELVLFGAGLWLYTSATRPADRRGTGWLVATAALLLVIYVLNMFSPPPPSVEAVAWSALAMWLLVAMGYKIDRHRTPVRT